MIKNILLVFFGLFFLLPIFIISAAFFGKAPTCPNNQVSGTALDLKSLEKTGTITMTNAQATKMLNQTPNDSFQDLAACFTENEAHISGKLAKAPFKPSFYISVSPDIEGTNLKVKNVKAQVGWLPSIKPIENFATERINEYIADMRSQESINVEIKEDELKLTFNRVQEIRKTKKY